MTIREVADAYGVREIEASCGDNILSLVDRIYGSRADVYFEVLTRLNNYYNWNNFIGGESIKYIPKDACINIYEIASTEY